MNEGLTTAPADCHRLVSQAGTCAPSRLKELLIGLLKLGTVQIKLLRSDIEFQELTIAVQQLSFDSAPDIDGVLTESYKRVQECLECASSLE